MAERRPLVMIDGIIQQLPAGDTLPPSTSLSSGADPVETISAIAGIQPTLYLNFKDQDYRIYSPATGLTRKPLTDIVTTTRASTGSVFDAKGQLATIAADTPRVTFDPETGVGEGLLVEESRTNLLTYSEDFTNAAWVKAGATITANAALAPDWTLTADKAVGNSGSAYPTIAFTTTSITQVVPHYASFFVKAAENKIARLQTQSGVFPATAIYFDFNTMASSVFAGSPVNIIMQDVGNGWYRCGFGVTPTGTGGGTFAIYLDDDTSSGYTGDGTSGIYIWGTQLEEGSFPTSYVKSEGTAVTRAADAVKIDGTAFSDFYAAGNSLIASYADAGVMSEQSKSLTTEIVLSSYIDGSGAIAEDKLGALTFFPSELTAAQVSAIEGVI